MQALRFHEFGKPQDVLKLEPLELPPLAEGEVRLKILAAPVNPADLNFIEGTYGVKPELPAVPGIEGCGEVIESRSSDLRIGDRAIMLRRAGSWATHVQLPADHLFKIPADLDPLQAAMLKVNPATAWRLLTGTGTPASGSWIVQNAANSAVGRCVIAVARELGIRTINLVRRPELIDELQALGADLVVTDDDAGMDAVKSAGAGKPALAFNCVGGESALRLMNLLAPGGIHITYGAMARRPLTVPNGLLIFKDLQLRGLWITKWIESAPKQELDEAYAKLAALMTNGSLTMPVDSTHSLESSGTALERVSAAGRDGKVLLVP
ncbi:2-enoyl thioester reductase domain-containing protein [Luteolibacter flavescens]|uniref:enoyl-[acyl-carrier-protein] reductase n=1 Tax=Luteolibacter flavescens TaxID=1859460 RepID=A0ABT3FU62_9BACT|nr:2-enoyl thioester reductase domain-containing protein [Luteolibacter flavescens]MCW1887108.1 2-enoyl thioester reductase domain-containing protein [Luteolibacter flavescens]